MSKQDVLDMISDKVLENNRSVKSELRSEMLEMKSGIINSMNDRFNNMSDKFEKMFDVIMLKISDTSL